MRMKLIKWRGRMPCREWERMNAMIKQQQVILYLLVLLLCSYDLRTHTHTYTFPSKIQKLNEKTWHQKHITESHSYIHSRHAPDVGRACRMFSWQTRKQKERTNKQVYDFKWCIIMIMIIIFEYKVTFSKEKDIKQKNDEMIKQRARETEKKWKSAEHYL